jgi:hypothetical protein
LLRHPLTDSGLAQFLADYQKGISNWYDYIVDN